MKKIRPKTDQIYLKMRLKSDQISSKKSGIGPKSGKSDLIGDTAFGVNQAYSLEHKPIKIFSRIILRESKAKV